MHSYRCHDGGEGDLQEMPRLFILQGQVNIIFNLDIRRLLINIYTFTLCDSKLQTRSAVFAELETIVDQMVAWLLMIGRTPARLYHPELYFGFIFGN